MRKIQSKAIHKEVATQIREMIRDSKFVKGQRIDKKYICQNMGLSRTPLKESLRMLNAEGLVQLIPHKGAYVSDPHIDVRKGGYLG
jgi:DNA-binding GntR family transcriptional regulator